MLTVIAILAAAGQSPELGCLVLSRDIDAGDHIVVDAVEQMACRPGAQPELSVRFDPESGSMVASEGLTAGTYLGRLWAIRAQILPKGTLLTLQSVSGPARVERQVVTLQPVRLGQRVFVRDTGGNVFAARLAFQDEGASRE